MDSMEREAFIWILTGTAYETFFPLHSVPYSFQNRLERIRKALGGRTRIVLHGTNDFPDEIMKRCISGGVTKVNLNKLIMDKYTEHVNSKTGKMEYSKLMEGGIDAYQELIEHQMDVLGSTGKA